MFYSYINSLSPLTARILQPCLPVFTAVTRKICNYWPVNKLFWAGGGGGGGGLVVIAPEELTTSLHIERERFASVWLGMECQMRQN